MSIQNITVTGEAGSETVVATPRSFTEAAFDIVAMPFGVTAEDTVYVQKKTAALGSIAWGAAGFLVGEAYGHKRERHGSNSFIPLFRG